MVDGSAGGAPQDSPAHGRYYVYVIELDESKRRGGSETAVYIGQSALTPEERFARHRAGHKSSRHVRGGHGLRLRPDLYEHINPLATRVEAEAMEQALAEFLRRRGFTVYSA